MIITNSTINKSVTNSNLSTGIDNFYASFLFNSDNIFEKEGVLSLLLSPTCDFYNIKITDLNNNIIEEFKNYKDYKLQYKCEKNDFKITVDFCKKTSDSIQINTISKIKYFNAFNTKKQNFLFSPLINNEENNLVTSLLQKIINKNQLIKIYFQKKENDFDLGAFYFYDLENSEKSHLPIDYFKFSDFNRKEIILDQNKLVIGKDLMKYNTRFFMAYPIYDASLSKIKLILADYLYYLLFWNLYTFINLLNKKYNYNSIEYKFITLNPFNKNDDLVFWIL